MHLQFNSAARERLVNHENNDLDQSRRATSGYVGCNAKCTMRCARNIRNGSLRTANARRVIFTKDALRNCLVFPEFERSCASNRMKAQSARRVAVFIATLVAFSGCASTRVASSDHLRRDVAAADVAYRELAPNHTGAYNAALDSIARNLDLAAPTALRDELSQARVKIAEPAVELSETEAKATA